MYRSNESVSFSLPIGTKMFLTEKAAELGKKKSQIMVEALQDYFDAIDAANEIAAYESGKYKDKMTSLDEAKTLINAA